MNFYNSIHPYYCGIDLHARTLYVCIIDQEGKTCLHKEISANPDKLLKLSVLNACTAGIGWQISARIWGLILSSAMPCT